VDRRAPGRAAPRPRPPTPPRCRARPHRRLVFADRVPATIVIRRVRQPHDPESMCPSHTIGRYLTTRTYRQNAGALLQYDIRDLIGTYKAACMAADELLFRAGNTEAVDLACRTAAIGKLTPEALYVHISTLAVLPPLLRVYEGCARALVGTVEKANILKLSRREARVSYLSYPAFEQDPHPPLQSAVVASLTKLRVDFRDYHESVNPPILHRKEALVATDHPLWRKFARLTAQEERFGLYADATAIGTKAGWTQTLAQAGVTLRGHRVLRVPPALTSEPGTASI
jgi:DNA phosphorothioation-associated putative methyltransferase